VNHSAEIVVVLALLVGFIWAVLAATRIHVPYLEIVAVVGLLAAVVWALLASLSVLVFGLSAADLSHEPEASITFPGARVERAVLREAQLDIIWGGDVARFRREYRTAAPLSEVVGFYRQELGARGWHVLVGLGDFDACARGLQFTVRGLSAMTFETEMYPHGRFTHPPECKQGTPPAPEAVALIAVSAFTVYIGAASQVQRRARRARGGPVRAGGGVARWGPAFVWVPYVVLDSRPGPTIAPGELTVYVGIALIVVGAAFALWAASTLGNHFDLEPEVHKDHVVVRRGPYRFVRHPVYLGLGVHLVGACIASGNLVLILGVLLVGFPLLYLRARAEEQLLRAELGSAYDDYVREVGMFLPRVARRPA
jgi:protein-S-isoprenylcysteine O-methyltransferase Ste14